MKTYLKIYLEKIYSVPDNDNPNIFFFHLRIIKTRTLHFVIKNTTALKAKTKR